MPKKKSAPKKKAPPYERKAHKMPGGEMMEGEMKFTPHMFPKKKAK